MALPVQSAFCFGARIAFLDTLSGWMLHCEPSDRNKERFSRTLDGGISWDSLYVFDNSHFFYTFDALDASHFWLAGYNGFLASVQFSSDGGRSWTEQMPGVGDNIVGFDAVDAYHAYAVGGNGYIYIFSPSPLNGIIGDMNQDSLLSAADVVLLVNRTFTGSSICVPLAYIDFNNDCRITAADIVLLLNKVFVGGPPFKPGCAGP